MATQTGVGWTNEDGSLDGFKDICLARLLFYQNRKKLETATDFYIDLDYTLKDVNTTNWKGDYRQLMSLAYREFGMSRVFKLYIKPCYPGLSLKAIVRKSIKDEKLYISTDIPYLLFLMLVTLLRYAGERNKRFSIYKDQLKNFDISVKYTRALILLCTESLDELSTKTFIIEGGDVGHSLSDCCSKRVGGILPSLKSLKRRVDRHIKESQQTIRNLKNLNRKFDLLHKLIVPSQYIEGKSACTILSTVVKKGHKKCNGDMITCFVTKFVNEALKHG